MTPILFSANSTTFTTNGLGRLSDAISCNVVEEINGQYELTMVYPVDGIHFEDLAEHRIIYSVHDESGSPQPFEIYRISRPINRRVTVNASHISYRLNKMVLLPFTAGGVQTALTYLVSKAVAQSPFTFSSDKTTVKEITLEKPVSLRAFMGGMQGSLIDTYGGEWEFNGFSCALKNRRGSDTDLSIRYGKNMTDVTKTVDSTNFWTGVVPFWNGKDPDTNQETSIVYNGIIHSSVYQQYPYEMLIALDASNAFENPPTQTELQDFGTSYVQGNASLMPKTSIKVSFVQLWQTEEYKNVASLQRLHIGDSVNVFYEEMGIDNTARIVSYDFNVLLNRYDSMTIGDIQAKLSTAINSDIENATKELPTKTFFEEAITAATNLITGGLGGYVVINRDADGHPDEILIMDTDDKTTATNVMRFNKNGIGFSTSGYNGPFNSAWTINGTFDAQVINVINLNAASIVAGILKDALNRSYWNLDTGEMHIENGVISTTAKVDVTRTDTTTTEVSGGRIKFKNSLGSATASIFADTVGGMKFDADSNAFLNLDGLYIGKIASSDNPNIVSAWRSYVGTSYDNGIFWYSTYPVVLDCSRLYVNGYISTDGINGSGKSLSFNANGAVLQTNSGSFTVYGDFLVYDYQYKMKVITTEDYEERGLFCYEMADPIFGDIGSGETDESGFCVVAIDDIFQETIESGIEYHVFLQKEGRGDIWVEEKTPSYFVVAGDPQTKFSWEVKARQKGMQADRLEKVRSEVFAPKEELSNDQDIENMLMSELDDFIAEQEALLDETA